MCCTVQLGKPGEHGSVVDYVPCLRHRDFFENNNSVIATQRIFRLQFNIGRYGRVPVGTYQELGTDPVTKRRPGGSVRTVRTPKNIETVPTALGRSPKLSARRHSVAFNMSNTLSFLQNTDCAESVISSFCFKKSVL
jgi:hypothetical protein